MPIFSKLEEFYILCKRNWRWCRLDLSLSCTRSWKMALNFNFKILNACLEPYISNTISTSVLKFSGVKDIDRSNNSVKKSGLCEPFLWRAPSKLAKMKNYPSSRSRITLPPTLYCYQFSCTDRPLPILSWVTKEILLPEYLSANLHYRKWSLTIKKSLFSVTWGLEDISKFHKIKIKFPALWYLPFG